MKKKVLNHLNRNHQSLLGSGCCWNHCHLDCYSHCMPCFDCRRSLRCHCNCSHRGSHFPLRCCYRHPHWNQQKRPVGRTLDYFHRPCSHWCRTASCCPAHHLKIHKRTSHQNYCQNECSSQKGTLSRSEDSSSLPQRSGSYQVPGRQSHRQWCTPQGKLVSPDDKEI
jgi:hypothetical protein